MKKLNESITMKLWQFALALLGMGVIATGLSYFIAMINGIEGINATKSFIITISGVAIYFLSSINMKSSKKTETK